MKFSFFVSIIFAIVVSILALSNDRKTRIMLLILVILLYYTYQILFAMEYDSMRSKEWKKRENKILEEAYLKFYKDFKQQK